MKTFKSKDKKTDYEYNAVFGQQIVRQGGKTFVVPLRKGEPERNIAITLLGIGNKVKDKQTGFIGKITAIAIYEHDVTSYQVQADSKDKNTYPTNAWFSENRLVKTK